MQLGLATSLLKYKPEMHDSWVDPKVRPLQSFPIMCMHTPSLLVYIRLPTSADYRLNMNALQQRTRC